MGDAPACPDCGHITIRNGSCYKCLNCGNSLAAVKIVKQNLTINKNATMYEILIIGAGNSLRLLGKPKNTESKL